MPHKKMPTDLINDCEGLPDGLYDDRVWGLRIAICGGGLVSWCDRDRLDDHRLVMNAAWARPWGFYPDPALYRPVSEGDEFEPLMATDGH